MAQCVKALQMNRKIPGSNPTWRSASFRGPTLLRGPQWTSGRETWINVVINIGWVTLSSQYWSKVGHGAWWHFFESLLFFIACACHNFIFHHKAKALINCKTCFLFHLKCSSFLRKSKFLKFSSLPKALWSQEEVEDEINMTKSNGFHKLPITISGKTPKPLSVFELRHQKWPSDHKI